MAAKPEFEFDPNTVFLARNVIARSKRKGTVGKTSDRLAKSLLAMLEQLTDIDKAASSFDRLGNEALVAEQIATFVEQSSFFSMAELATAIRAKAWRKPRG